MIALFRLHSYYLLTTKTKRLATGFIITMLSIFFLLTQPFDDAITRILYHQSYLLDYSIDGFTLIKMALFVTGFYTVLHLSLVTPYDIVLVQRTNTYMYILSKYLTIWIYTTLTLAILWGYFILFSYLIYGTLHPLISVNTAVNMLILTTVYTLLLYTVSLLSKHYLTLILVMFSFFISDMLVTMHTGLDNISTLGLLANIIAPNMHILNNEQIGFVFPLRIILYLLIVYVLGVIKAVLTYEN